jgi:hypothetical protein
MIRMKVTKMIMTMEMEVEVEVEVELELELELETVLMMSMITVITIVIFQGINVKILQKLIESKGLLCLNVLNRWNKKIL